MYKVIRNKLYDFAGESYSSRYPNLHRYPATMIPQIGIELFKELNIKYGKLLDPYCGSGTSFIVGLERGLKEMEGFDINPLAILISSAKFTKVDVHELKSVSEKIKNKLFEFYWKNENLEGIKIPDITNINYWFSKTVIKELSVLKSLISKITKRNLRIFLHVPFSETIKECSYSKNGEFKLFRMSEQNMKNFYPKTYDIFISKLDKAIYIYEKYYEPLLDNSKIHLGYKRFPIKEYYYDIVLTSPPYGDSKTTVAYGQFSALSNEWIGIDYARKVDSLLMGGKVCRTLYQDSLISEYITRIAKISHKRALEVSSYYFDLENSIRNVSFCIKPGGKVIYIVGNRTVKDVLLPTDQFIAEKFEHNGFKHLFTYERIISNKAMPSFNSPTNQTGVKRATMSKEYLIVCEKKSSNTFALVNERKDRYKTTTKRRNKNIKVKIV